ncbi:BTB/POZ domain-containing protein At5g66560-like [Mangifera indica]|uniref:BTB/POZ domain-containing protein At5g66560-like n=1 Tax=Mangifera indica TaxID=29780 RepID=UPI001CF971AA|nr:BTB/POZ domain-containing protein At5g66560-like [Mangifera indica]
MSEKMAAEKPTTSSASASASKGQAWFCTTGLPSDIVIEVDDMTFHLHKFPLMSKSRKLHQMITEQETNPSTSIVREEAARTEIEEEEEEITCNISFPDFPGGSETFEMVAKFCYGVKMELSSSTVAPLRCAGEYLEMTEDYAEDNLISKTERYFAQSVFKSLKESIKCLKSCEKVISLAESLNIIHRCINSIVSRASSADPALFGWPVTEGGGTSNQGLWNGIENGLRRRGAKLSESHSWFEDLSLLSLSLFKRLMNAMKEGDLSQEIIESCLMHYAKKYIPGLSRASRKPSSSSTIHSETEQRELLETVIVNLPLEKSAAAASTTATRFLFGLLRAANILNASESCRSALEKKIGSQLDQATLDDLLIPSYSYLNETLYDVNCIERILGYYLEGLQIQQNQDETARSPPLMLVGKLFDGYLSEIASDTNLKPDKFYNLATSLPDQARLFDDGLYRAVDLYLKAHPWLPEAEREKISGIIDCQKLTLEACTHAAQNERLPVRAVVQVLFFEQLQLRHAIAGTLLAAETAPQELGRTSGLRQEEEEAEVEAKEEEVVGGEASGSATWRAAVRENQVLRLDMDSMRTRVHQLERECSTMKKVIEKIEKKGGPGGGWRESVNRKFGCKFKTQVCDSHEQTVVDNRKGRQHQRQQQ